MQGRLILLTGASGFIGRETAKVLKKKGCCVIQGQWRKATVGSSGGYVYLNLNHPEEILALASEIKCDVIVHLGARIGWSNETDEDLYVPNVLASGLLSYLAKKWGAYFIFSSMAGVHGSRVNNIHHDSPLNPDTAYGKSKWLAEQLIAMSGVKHCILRIAGVFGAEGPGHLGLNKAIESAQRGECPVQIGLGIALRNYIYVKDVAETIAFLIERQLTGTHLAAGYESLTIHQMLQMICDVFLPGRQPVMKDGPEAAHQIVECSKALPATRSFKDALTDIQRSRRD